METRKNFVFSVLDTASDAQRLSYERALYRAFGPSEILERIWTIDRQSKRTVAKIPYDTQEIYTASTGERIVAAAAVNFRVGSPLQLELEGFSIDKAAPGVCEIIQMFCLLDVMSSATLLRSFTRFFLEKLLVKGAKKMYGTCSERRVRPYQAIGLRVIGELVYKGEKVFLLEMDLERGMTGHAAV